MWDLSELSEMLSNIIDLVRPTRLNCFRIPIAPIKKDTHVLPFHFSEQARNPAANGETPTVQIHWMVNHTVNYTLE